MVTVTIWDYEEERKMKERREKKKALNLRKTKREKLGVKFLK